ncbi:glycosyltransferase family 4 protein [Croceibacterium sp. TMG7-5b_MA50]|uniref:glycosyltransferase family 4 protein n=1 Tax=Croceibacterium sp. TMG7-5b_MA50 TaxID=3121290 RepID=UPI003221E031
MVAQSRVAVFHPGTQHSWQTARAAQQLGRLQWYATSILYQADRWPYKLDRLPAPLGPKLAREFRRFEAPGLDTALAKTFGADEWLERMAQRAGWVKLARWFDKRGNRAFGRALAREIGRPEPFALWGYDNSAREAFEHGRAHGRTCILDRTIGDNRALNRTMAELHAHWPDWFATKSDPIPDWRLRQQDEEYELADVIVAGSQTCADTVVAESPVSGLAAKLRVLPYCFDETLFGGQPAPAPVTDDEPVRFLLVGHLGPRKGLHLLLQALDHLPRDKFTLTLLGEIVSPPATVARYADRITHIPPVPRREVPGIMARHHVFIFPSYFEGSAVSLLEAMASGLALIQSPQAGQGVTPDCGLLLPEQTVEAVAEAMLAAIEDRERLNSWRRAAQAESRNYTFARYRDRIATLLDSLPG